MATEEKRSKGNPTQDGPTFEVITLTSDEEDESDCSDEQKYSFDRFILACRQHTEKEELSAARDLFKSAPLDLTSSKEVTEILKRSAKLVNKENASRLLSELCAKLKSSKVTNGSTGTTSNINSEARSCADVTKARDFEEVSEPLVCRATDVVEASDDEVDFVREVHNRVEKSVDKPSTSTGHRHRDDELKFPKTGKMATKDLTSRQKKRLGVKLRRRLKEISQQIKILNKSELTLDEMDMPDSSYIKENQLKKKFDKTWNKLCKILGRPPKTGRVIEKSIKPTPSGYIYIDQAVEEFMKHKQGKFPDYFDIRDVVMKANVEHDLRISQQVLKGIIADVFTDIGNKLQRLREKDLLFNFGSHLLDDFNAETDPALSSEDLLQKLEKNRKISKRNLKHVYEKYTHLERYEKSGRKAGTSTETGAKQDDSSDIENSTSSDDEREINRTLTDVTAMSEDDDFVNHTGVPSSPYKHLPKSFITEDDSIDNVSIAQPIEDHVPVSIFVDCDGIDDSSARETNMALNTSRPVKLNSETEYCTQSRVEDVDDSLLTSNDDCCIIDSPESSQNPSDLPTPPVNMLSVDEKPCSSKEQPVVNHLNKTEGSSKKRKLHVEELVSALKRKKLKAPDNQTNKILSPFRKENGEVSLCDTTSLVNGHTPIALKTDEHTSEPEEVSAADSVAVSTSNKLKKFRNAANFQHKLDKVSSSPTSRRTCANGKNGFLGHANTNPREVLHNTTQSPTGNNSKEKNTIIQVIIIDD